MARRRYRPKPPDAAVIAYRAILRRALARAEGAIEDILAPKLTADAKPRVRYGLRAVEADVDPEEITAIAGRTERANMRELRKSLPKELLARVESGLPDRMIERFRKKNVDLITSLVDGELEEITAILDVGFKKGTRVEDLRKQIRERFDVTRSKADLLATDQVLKLNGQITKTRQTQAGIVSYTWSTSGDERVRDMHAELDGTVQQWSDPPVTNDDGDTNHPGEDYRCRCVAIPILPPLDTSADET